MCSRLSIKKIFDFFETHFYFPRLHNKQTNQIEVFLSEKELIKQCRSNNYSAQLKVYHTYKNSLLNASYRIVQNVEDAEDIVQESFIKAFEKIHKLDGEYNLTGWLKRIAINASLDFLRKKKQAIEWNDLQLVEESTEEEQVEMVELYGNLTVFEVKEFINQLKEKYRIILILYLIEDYTHKEISEMLGINESTVRNQYARGKQQLIQKIKSSKHEH